jgi:2'-5' RNA ligase
VKNRDRIRVFVALEIPGEIRETIRREQQLLKTELPRARWTRPEGQHLTLRFLGETAEDEVSTLAAGLSDRVAGLSPILIRLYRSGFYPSPRRPRVAWIGGTDGGGVEAAAAVDLAAVEAGFAPERRPWSLHLTQARLDRPWPRPAVQRFLDWGRGLDLPPFECREVVLFRSDLRSGGAVYTALERFPLE